MTRPTTDYHKIVAGIAMHTRIHPAMLRAISLARSTAGEVALVHASRRAVEGPAATDAMVFQDAPARCSELKARYPEITSTCIKVAPIMNAVIETARGIDADLIAIGSHVHSQLAALVGKTSDRVLHQADRDVLIARTERYVEDQVPGPYRHILLATDLRDQHHRVAERAAALARQQEAALSLLHVVDHYPVDRENDDIAPEDVDPETYQSTVKGQRLAQLATETGHVGAACTVLITSDAARAAIPRHAQQIGADLIVIGSRRPTGLHLLLGTTADEVVHHAPCDVLVVYIED